MLGESEKYYFYFDDRCFSALGVFFVITCASIFLNLFLLEGQDGVGELSERYFLCVKETWGGEEYAFILQGIFSVTMWISGLK